MTLHIEQPLRNGYDALRVFLGVPHAQRYGSAGTTQYSQGSSPLHFGIPPGGAIEHLTVRWPDGREETHTVGAEDRFVELRWGPKEDGIIWAPSGTVR